MIATYILDFLCIHPFIDGNGRIGRLLISLQLCEQGLLPQPLLYLSAFFEKHRSEYYARLLAISQKGEWEAWIRFFLKGVAEQSKDSVARSERLLDLRKRYQEKVQTPRTSILLQRLIDMLFEVPALTTKRVVEESKITPAAAQNNINKLVEAGILKEATGRKRNRIYVAHEILELLESDP